MEVSARKFAESQPGTSVNSSQISNHRCSHKALVEMSNSQEGSVTGSQGNDDDELDEWRVQSAMSSISKSFN